MERGESNRSFYDDRLSNGSRRFCSVVQCTPNTKWVAYSVLHMMAKKAERTRRVREEKELTVDDDSVQVQVVAIRERLTEGKFGGQKWEKVGAGVVDTRAANGEELYGYRDGRQATDCVGGAQILVHQQDGNESVEVVGSTPSDPQAAAEHVTQRNLLSRGAE